MLNNKFYTLPFEFTKLKQKKAHKTCDIKSSVGQYIHLITTTYLGEYSIDPDFGCSIWEFDFDNTITNNKLKEDLKKSLTYALERYERRIHNIEVSVTIKQAEIEEISNNKRIKKRIEVAINAVLLATNEKFNYFEYFYLGPLSYY